MDISPMNTFSCQPYRSRESDLEREVDRSKLEASERERDSEEEERELLLASSAYLGSAAYLGIDSYSSSRQVAEGVASMSCEGTSSTNSKNSTWMENLWDWGRAVLRWFGVKTSDPAVGSQEEAQERTQREERVALPTRPQLVPPSTVPSNHRLLVLRSTLTSLKNAMEESLLDLKREESQEEGQLRGEEILLRQEADLLLLYLIKGHGMERRHLGLEGQLIKADEQKFCHAHHTRLMGKIAKLRQDISQKVKHSEILGWINLATSIVGIGAGVILFVVGGPVGLAALAALSSVASGGGVIAKGIIDYQGSLQQGTLSSCKTDRHSTTGRMESVVQSVSEDLNVARLSADYVAKALEAVSQFNKNLGG